MRLYKTKIPTVAALIVERMVKDEDIEVSNVEEANLDVEAVLNEYLRLDREITEQAKDKLENRGLSYSSFGRIKRDLAEQRGLGEDEETISWICNQVLETFMHSPHVEEVFAEDVVMRRKLKDILRNATAVESELDEEVRKRIKNIKEGTDAWDIEYKNKMSDIRRKHGLD
jgi:uncharacterized protein